MLKKRLTLKLFVLLVFSDLLETAVHFFLKKSAMVASISGVKSMAEFLPFMRQAFLTPYLWIAFALVFTTFVVWSTILSKIDLSVAVPIASFSYIFVPLVSIIFLHEKISVGRWLGISCIVVGVIFVSLSTRQKQGAVS